MGALSLPMAVTSQDVSLLWTCFGAPPKESKQIMAVDELSFPKEQHQALFRIYKSLY